MFVETNSEISIEGRYPMELFLPKDDLPIKFEGRIAFCKEVAGKESRLFDLGIEFFDIAVNDKSKLRDFIDDLYEI